MNKFTNVSVTKAANIYFDGNVSSRTVEFANGSLKTLGLMLPGEYEFTTDAAELIEIMAGELEVLLPAANWQKFKGGESFNVPGNASFQVKVSSATDYVCSFL